MTLLDTFLADFSDGIIHLIPIVVPSMVFLFIAAIVIAGMFFQHQKQKLWHETMRVALEKGQPLPPMPDDSQQAKADKKQADLTPGLILISIGIALFIGLPQISSGIPLIGAYATGFLGVALLISAILKRTLDKPKDGKTE